MATEILCVEINRETRYGIICEGDPRGILLSLVLQEFTDTALYMCEKIAQVRGNAVNLRFNSVTYSDVYFSEYFGRLRALSSVMQYAGYENEKMRANHVISALWKVYQPLRVK